MKMREEHRCFEEKEKRHLFKIGMFAQMNHVTIKTLRFYEEQGLLLPAFVDTENGYRYYTMDQMAVLHRITALKQAGFTLEDIRKLNGKSNPAAFLSRKKKEIMSKIAELTTQLARIEEYMDESGDSLASPVLIRQIPAVVVASMQDRIF